MNKLTKNQKLAWWFALIVLCFVACGSIVINILFIPLLFCGAVGMIVGIIGFYDELSSD